MKDKDRIDTVEPEDMQIKMDPNWRDPSPPKYAVMGGLIITWWDTLSRWMQRGEEP